MPIIFLLISLLLAAVLLFFTGLEKHPQPKAVDREKIAAPILLKNTPERSAKRIVLRVRNSSCGGLATGSGFLADEKLLITNKHVIDKSTSLSASTWDGQSIDFALGQARVTRKLDIGFIRLKEEVAPPSKIGGRVSVGERLTVVGYPKGQELTLTRGTFKGYLSGKKLLGSDYPGQIIVLKADVRRGNSGGPVLDESGRVVAVLFAAAFKKGKTFEAYAIPIGQALTFFKKDKEKTRPIAGCS